MEVTAWGQDTFKITVAVPQNTSRSHNEIQTYSSTALLKRMVVKWKTVQRSNKSRFHVPLWKHEFSILQTEDESDRPASAH